MAGQPGFFDVDEWYVALSAAGDPLERLSAVVDLEIFLPVLEAALARSDRSRGGRPPYDAVLMFSILVLQALYSLSDDPAREGHSAVGTSRCPRGGGPRLGADQRPLSAGQAQSCSPWNSVSA
jgi:hypothetical protein